MPPFQYAEPQPILEVIAPLTAPGVAAMGGGRLSIAAAIADDAI